MRRELLQYLRCPVTHASLDLLPFEEDDGGNVREGLLRSSTGGRIYPIVGGVPSMLPNNVPPHFVEKYAQQARAAGIDMSGHVSPRKDDWSFSAEWNTFFDGKVKRTWIWDLVARQRMFIAEVGLPHESLADKVVFDAGCGNGELTNALGSTTAMCIGLDFSTSVFLAEEHRTSDRTHFVQGDLSNPPFNQGVFDLVYCSGVLHHNRDARSAFASVSRLVKEKGLFYCWLYRWENSPKALFYNVITEIIRPFASRAPSKFRDLIAKAWAAAIFAAYRLMGRRDHSYEELVVGSYDVLTPRYASRHTPIQMARWFHENGFGAATLTHWDNPNGFGMVAARTKIEETPGIHFGQSP